MTHTDYRPLPDEDEYFGGKIVIAFKKVESEVTGRGYDKSRDEVHESTSTLDSETVRFTCPVKSFRNKSTGEELDEEDIAELANEYGFDETEQIDVDEVKYVAGNGETYIGTYDVSSLPDL